MDRKSGSGQGGDDLERRVRRILGNDPRARHPHRGSGAGPASSCPPPAPSYPPATNRARVSSPTPGVVLIAAAAILLALYLLEHGRGGAGAAPAGIYAPTLTTPANTANSALRGKGAPRAPGPARVREEGPARPANPESGGDPAGGATFLLDQARQKLRAGAYDEACGAFGMAWRVLRPSDRAKVDARAVETAERDCRRDFVAGTYRYERAFRPVTAQM